MVANRRRWLHTPPPGLPPNRCFYDDLTPFVGGLPMLTVKAEWHDWRIVFDHVIQWISPDCQIAFCLLVRPGFDLRPVLADRLVARIANLSVHGEEAPEQPTRFYVGILVVRLPISGEQASALAGLPRIHELRRVALSELSPEARTIVAREIAPHVWTEVKGLLL